MALYALSDDATIILRTSDGAFIPVAPGNADYEGYLTWLAGGGTPDPYVAPAPAVPAQVTRWQAMQMMLATPSKVHPSPATLFSDVQAIVTSTGGAMAMAWANQQFLYRTGPFLTPALMAAVGLSNADVDALFIAAEQLPP